MSFLSGLRAFGTDIEKAFAWFGSSKGKAVVAGAEGVLEAAIPASIPIIDLMNTWAAKIFNIESIAVAAGKGTGTGVEKAAAVDAAISPEVLAYIQQAGVSARTDAQLKAANDGLVQFLNAMSEPNPPAPTGGISASSSGPIILKL